MPVLCLIFDAGDLTYEESSDLLLDGLDDLAIDAIQSANSRFSIVKSYTVPAGAEDGEKPQW